MYYFLNYLFADYNIPKSVKNQAFKIKIIVQKYENTAFFEK